MIKTIEVYWNCFCNWEASWVNFRNSDFESFLSEEIASEKWAFMQNYEDEIEVRLVKMANFRLLGNSVSAGGINDVIVQLIEVLLTLIKKTFRIFLRKPFLLSQKSSKFYLQGTSTRSNVFWVLGLIGQTMRFQYLLRFFGSWIQNGTI